MISCKLKDVCKLVKGKQIDTTQLAENLPFKYINGGVKESGYYEKYNTNGNTIIISEGGASCGYVSYITEKFWLGCHCYKLIDVSVDSKYLFYALKANQQRIMELRTGAAMPNIKKTILNELQIKISMDEAEQKQAVKNLDYIEHLLEIENTALLSLDELTKSRFIEMFGDSQFNPNKYQVMKLSSIATYFNGLTYKPEDVADSGVIVLRSSNIQNNGLDFKDIIRVSCEVKDRYMVKQNDILMCSRNGSAKLVGKVALIKLAFEPMAFGAFMMIIRSPYYQYLLSYFQTEDFRRQIKRGVTATINQITRGMLDEVNLPVPPLRIVNEFESFVHQVDKSKLVIKKTIAELEELKSSLMQKYFFD